MPGIVHGRRGVIATANQGELVGMFRQLGKDLTEHYRHLMVMKIGGKSLGKLVDYPVVQKEALLEQANKLSLPEILRSLELLIEAQETASTAVDAELSKPLTMAALQRTLSTLTFSGSLRADSRKDIGEAA